MRVDFVCTKCQESRYRTRIDVDATTKLIPEILEPFGDQPPAETFKDKPTCFQCGGPLIGNRDRHQHKEVATHRKKAVRIA